MKRLGIVVLAALFLALPATAATTTTSSSTTVAATLTSANDAVVIAASGLTLASIRWTVTAAGNGGITTEWTKDALGTASVNWLPTPQSTLISTVSANPSTAPWANNTPVAGTYETPLPGNCTAYRIRYQTGGTATAVTLIYGRPYIPGVPVVATLWDVTSAVNTAIDTGVLDLSGWEASSAYYVTPAGGSGAIKVVDDAGTAVSLHTVPASAATMVALALAGPSNVTAVATTGTVSIGLVAKRMQFTSAAVAALTSRIRIEARR